MKIQNVDKARERVCFGHQHHEAAVCSDAPRKCEQPKIDKALLQTPSDTAGVIYIALNEHDIPCGPILSTQELIEDETLAELGSVVEVPHPERGSFKTVGCPLKLSDSPVEITPSPLLGEHTEEVLHEVMGYDKEKVDQLRNEGVV